MSSSPARARLFAKMLGPAAEVVHDRSGLLPAIDVSIHRPGHGDREFYTLITDGMSDRPMNVPNDVDVKDAARRVELALYVDQPGPTVIALLQTLARLPHQQELWVGHGHTMPNGDPPAPLFPASKLSVILMLLSNVAPESGMSAVLEIDGDPVSVLMPMPITAAECAFKLEHGLEALLAVFNEKQLSFVLDPGRASVV